MRGRVGQLGAALLGCVQGQPCMQTRQAGRRWQRVQLACAAWYVGNMRRKCTE
jgi:hypothetical protein